MTSIGSDIHSLQFGEKYVFFEKKNSARGGRPNERKGSQQHSSAAQACHRVLPVKKLLVPIRIGKYDSCSHIKYYLKRCDGIDELNSGGHENTRMLEELAFRTRRLRDNLSMR